jgi:hypothetical protein
VAVERSLGHDRRDQDRCVLTPENGVGQATDMGIITTDG